MMTITTTDDFEFTSTMTYDEYVYYSTMTEPFEPCEY